MSDILSKEMFLVVSKQRLLEAISEYEDVPPAADFELAFDRMITMLIDLDVKPVVWQLIFRGTGEGLRRMYGKKNSW